MTHTAEQFLDAILADPDDDTPRLIFADWLDESGQPARAEFIRCQIALTPFPVAPCQPNNAGLSLADWTHLRRRERDILQANARDWWPEGVCPTRPYSFKVEPPKVTLITGDGHWGSVIFARGFVHAVTLTAEACYGGVCQECGGTGQHPGYARVAWPCDLCSGTGKTPGVAGALFRSQPVEKVTLSDKIPQPSATSGDPRCSWQSDDRDLPSWVPYGLLKLMAELDGDDLDGRTWLVYATEAAALAALNDAACLYGRARAKELG